MPSCSLGTPTVEILWVYVYLHLSVHLSACTSVAMFSWNLCTTLDWSFVQYKSWSRKKVTDLDFPEKILFALLWQKGSILVWERNFLQISLKFYNFYPTTHCLLLLNGVWGGTCYFFFKKKIKRWRLNNCQNSGGTGGNVLIFILRSTSFLRNMN